MAEYIEREALLKVLRGSAVAKYPASFAMGLFAAADEVSKLPAADVKTVVHGRWVGLEYDGYADGCPVYDVWECSECGEEVSGEDVPITHPYCHGCGARMDG